ncbi:MAG TPA: L-serine ammonia-lyase, iron-sulfur-dependent subunit beta [Tepidisphaeraceae bacterium]|nr:L-serine ammonia-lyase, iron-sulfur-dependent subunit beta [Tepidisphaeraceae bacterium]
MEPSIFDIIGPVMVGPSSSHTAACVRIGRCVRSLLGTEPTSARVRFGGSFATTYTGHGSDRAIAAGLLGLCPDEPAINDSLEWARQRGLLLHIAPDESLPGELPVHVWVECPGRNVDVLAESLGGGMIAIRRINDVQVDLQGEGFTVLIEHLDHPGVIAHACNVLADAGINIGSTTCRRNEKGGKALLVLELDQPVDRSVLQALARLQDVTNVALLAPMAESSDAGI